MNVYEINYLITISCQPFIIMLCIVSITVCLVLKNKSPLKSKGVQPIVNYLLNLIFLVWMHCNYTLQCSKFF